jgi:cytochrome b561
MAANPAPSRYSRSSIALHWLMLPLLAAVYACIELREQFPRGSDPREALKTWHFMLGLTVFALVWIRALARLRGGTPPIVPAPAAWQRHAAALTHGLLYAFMLAMPLLGWLSLSADGKPVPFFGLGLPPLVGPDEALAEQVEDLHETLGVAGYWLIGLHAAAALFHHYVRRDDTLRRMLPGRR